MKFGTPGGPGLVLRFMISPLAGPVFLGANPATVRLLDPVSRRARSLRCGSVIQVRARPDVRPLTSETWPALADLFSPAGGSNGCWCMYWRLGPRYHERPREENRRDLRRLADSGRRTGLLAFDGRLAIGWCLLAPRAELAWLARARYLGPVDDLPVWSVPCFFVRRSHRHQGVTGTLIDAAGELARQAGAPALEAYPIDTGVPGHTRNLFPGVASVFAGRGFEVVARRRADRPIMRKVLGAAA
jgi:GNAT superfamily N-acetyltransferase